jgi:1,4-dihydroxy-2-naphthoate octaprenyltransferase
MTAAATSGPPSRVRLWVMGARPRTLGASVIPVAVGAAASGHVVVLSTALAALVALALQVGVNYANDYFDGVRGIDAERAGPVRLTGSRLVAPAAVARAAALALGVAAVAGAVLALTTQPVLLAGGALALVAAVLYSGGNRPYASLGLGEVAVLLFFGPVAVCGTALANAGHIPVAAVWASATPGLLSTALLVVNNLRDLGSDAVAGKRTLAVRLGERNTRVLFLLMITGGLGVPVAGVIAGGLHRDALLVLVALPLAIRPVRLVLRGRGRAVASALGATARLLIASGVLLTVGVAVR